MTPTPIVRPVLLAAAAIALCGATGGCSTVARLSGNSNALTIESTDASRSFSPSFTTAVYLPVDPQTAEVYLTDLPLERLRDSKDTLADVSGNIVHLHLFLVPKAGDTPIDRTACNITMRHLVLAGSPGESGTHMHTHLIAGLYSGGGFVLPSGTIGDDSIAGSITGSSHRLVKSSAMFNDALGSGAITGRFDATRDDEVSRAIGAKFETVARRLKAVSDSAGAAVPSKP